MIKIKDKLIKEFLNDNFDLNLFEIREVSLDLDGLDYGKQAYILEDLFGNIIMISRQFYPKNLILVTYGDHVIRTIKFIKKKCSDGRYCWCFYVEKEF